VARERKTAVLKAEWICTMLQLLLIDMSLVCANTGDHISSFTWQTEGTGLQLDLWQSLKLWKVSKCTNL